METKIEELIKEVKQLKESIEEIKGIQCEGTVLETAEVLEDKDIVEIETITKYADGKASEVITKYRYSKNNTCPEIELGMHPSG